MTRIFVPGVAPPADPSPAAHYFVCGPGGLLCREADGAVRLPHKDELAPLGIPLADAHYLGRLGQEDCFALFSPLVAATQPALAPGFTVRGLRKLYGSLPEELFSIAGRASQIAYWDDTHRFCGRCGKPLLRELAERAKRCPDPGCALSAFPRLSPAVIVLVRRGDEALLARSARFPIPMYSTLAGFVEPGESLEETVAREIHEEVGVVVGNVRYFGSQSWPFPHSLMVGFTAEYEGGELRPDGQEILDARFFRRDELPPIPPPISIARRLIDSWLQAKA